MTEQQSPQKLKVYGAAFCPDVGPVKRMLTQANVDFDYIDIRQDTEAAALVRQINNGNESVPTLVFPDGSTLTEPSSLALKARLEQLGYRVGWLAAITSNLWRIILFAIVIYGLLRLFEVI